MADVFLLKWNCCWGMVWCRLLQLQVQCVLRPVTPSHRLFLCLNHWETFVWTAGHNWMHCLLMLPASLLFSLARDNGSDIILPTQPWHKTKVGANLCVAEGGSVGAGGTGRWRGSRTKIRGRTYSISQDQEECWNQRFSSARELKSISSAITFQWSGDSEIFFWIKRPLQSFRGWSRIFVKYYIITVHVSCTVWGNDCFARNASMEIWPPPSFFQSGPIGKVPGFHLSFSISRVTTVSSVQGG